MLRSLWTKGVFGALLTLGLVSPSPAQDFGECIFEEFNAGVFKTFDVVTQHYPHLNGTLIQVFFVVFPTGGTACQGQTGIFFEPDGSQSPIFFQETPCTTTLRAAIPINGADWNLVELLSSGPPYGPSACKAALGLF